MLRKSADLLRKVLNLGNVAVIICYLLTCLVPFVNTETYWFVALLALVFPVILLVLCVFIVLQLFLKSKWWIVSAIVLLAGYTQITSTFAFHFPSDFSMDKPERTLRVIQWNVSDWDYQPNEELSYRKDMFALIEEQNADILFIEEFHEPLSKKRKYSNVEELAKLGFVHHYLIPSGHHKSSYLQGIGIFSKYPLRDTHYYPFEADSTGENLLQADIEVSGEKFRLFATHLQSVRFFAEDYQSISNIKKVKGADIAGSKQVAGKLKKGYELRFEQALLVHEKIKQSPYPAIVCGDFNDVPSSSTYFKIKGNLQDAFLKKGSFMGRTFRFISPTLRIDYILADRSFKVKQFKRLKVPYSDHYGLVADLAY